MPLQDVERLKAEASAAHAAGDLNLAVQLLTQAIKACNARSFGEGSPDGDARRKGVLSVLYSNRSAIRALDHLYISALVDAKAAIANNASWPKPYLRKATALLGLGQPHAALQVLDRGVAACTPEGTGQPPHDVWQLLSVRDDVEVAARMQQRAAKRMRPLPPLLRGSEQQRPTKPQSASEGATRDGLPAPLAPAPAALDSAAQVDPRPQESVPGGPELIRHCLDLLDASAGARGLKPGPQPDEFKVGITVISGFLGAGKTTLLKRILTEDVEHLANLAGGRAPSKTGSTSSGGGGSGDDAANNGTAAAGSVSGRTGARQPLKFGIVVNDMASVNIDGALAQDAAAVHRAHMGHVTPGDHEDSEADPVRNVVEMTNGCICCGLKGEMLLEVSQLLSKAPTINYLVIESTGVGQPMPIAAAFASPDDRGRTLLEYVRLDCLVTVVDAPQFHEDLRATHTPASDLVAQAVIRATLPEEVPPAAAESGLVRAGSNRVVVADDPMLLDPEDCKPLAELLAEQIEFADVVLLNKVDMCTGTVAASTGGAAGGGVPPGVSEVQRITDLIKGLNPKTHVVPTKFCDCPLSEVLNTRRFNFDAVQQAARWQQELLGPHTDASASSHDHAHETEMYGIHSMVYEARRPFHPGRLRAWLNLGLFTCLQPAADPSEAAAVSASSTTELIQPVLPTQLLRSKGFFWLASAPQIAWEWSTAGAAGRVAPYGEWLAGKLPRRCWPAEGRRPGWDAAWGDRCSSLVFITHGPADLGAIKTGLDSCLLTKEEEEQVDAVDPEAAAPSPAADKAAGGEGQGEEEEESSEESEDSLWFRREQAWAQLPGAHAWATLLE